MRFLHFALIALFCTTACTHQDDKEKLLAHAEDIEKQVLPTDTANLHILFDLASKGRWLRADV